MALVVGMMVALTLAELVGVCGEGHTLTDCGRGSGRGRGNGMRLLIVPLPAPPAPRNSPANSCPGILIQSSSAHVSQARRPRLHKEGVVVPAGGRHVVKRR